MDDVESTCRQRIVNGLSSGLSFSRDGLGQNKGRGYKSMVNLGEGH